MKLSLKSISIFIVAVSIAITSFVSASERFQKKKLRADPNNGGLKLPKGFGAVTVIPELGKSRHIVVNSNGDLYVKLDRLKDGKGIIVLKDKDGDGKSEIVNSFGDFTGTGIAIKNGYLYASSNNDVYRYRLTRNNEIDNTVSPERIVTGLIARRQHNTKSIALDNEGFIYVNIGAYSNSCQEQDRTKGSPGQEPCPILDSAAGIWQFKVNQLDQTYADGVRYCTGIRNIVGLDWNTSVNELYAVQHGRDQLNQLYPTMFDEKISAELPAEEMFLVKKGSNFGWPYCYYDQLQKEKVLAPEYGGDGKKVERCEGFDKPIVAFPGHWAPNALLFYTGKMFPAKYREGAFIAFHGSWNRAPFKQKGFNVAFVPFKNGQPSGKWEVFADGFVGKEEVSSPNMAKARPCGLAQGPDGSLYISDSVKGTIWRIIYTGISAAKK